MPNKNLANKTYEFNGQYLNYQALAMRLSRFNKARKDCSDNNDCAAYNNMGGDKKYYILKNIIKKAQDSDRNVKKAKMEGGMENAFIKDHTKDSKANATKTQNPRSSSVYKSIMAENKNLDEILKIKYLLEQVDNNKKNFKLWQ
jgi:hypothetical protein